MKTFICSFLIALVISIICLELGLNDFLRGWFSCVGYFACYNYREFVLKNANK